FNGIRRGLERSHENRRARDGEFPGRTEDGANVAGRSLFTYFDRRRLPRLSGGGHPQGRALHDPQVDFHQQVAISVCSREEEVFFFPASTSSSRKVPARKRIRNAPFRRPARQVPEGRRRI